MNLRLPPDPPGTAALLSRLAPAGGAGGESGSDVRSGGVYVACPIWNHPGFLDLIYPTNARPAEYLRHYARHFSAIELNTTYYGARPELLRRWREMVPADFRFVPKLSKSISHDRELRDCEDETLRFCHAIGELGENLGPLFLLLPGGFGPRRFDELARYLARFPRGLELAVELRHPAWFAEGAADGVWSLFEENDAIAVITDVAGRRDVLHQRLTSPKGSVMIRFVANGLHPTDYARLDEWIERLAHWLERGAKNVYFFLHQPDESQNVALAIYMIERLNLRCGLALRSPEPIARQQELF